jgi:tRNA C32,U32 (ribose-2'-O)-methylase TrmJ
MGFNDLALISPRDGKVLQRQKVIQRASGAIDVLRQTKIYVTLEEALADRNVICGTGMPFDMHRKRSHAPEDMIFYEPRVFFDKLIQSKSKEHVNNSDDEPIIRLALIFGGERRGKLGSIDLERPFYTLQRNMIASQIINEIQYNCAVSF